ncbi:MAG: hypothetical protein II576_01530, partial [Prevotella sp.]|nr:hypothetical protein [Prevotella sp.]
FTSQNYVLFSLYGFYIDRTMKRERFNLEIFALLIMSSVLAIGNNPPYLINCKDPLEKKGFRTGKFKITKDCILFATSDTLAHYILMMYEVTHFEHYAEELQEAINAQTKNSNFINTAMEMNAIDFLKDVIQKLKNSNRGFLLKNHIKGIKKKGLIGHDDYSIAMM